MAPHDLKWMQKALVLARQAETEGEVPVGAVLVDASGRLLSQSKNQVVTNHDPTAHAEVLAIREAGRVIQNYRLLDTTLYVTLEPCCMCAAALVHARVKRVVFATRDFKAGACGSVFNLLKGHPLNHQVLIDEGVLQEECAQLLTQFFESRRLI